MRNEKYVDVERGKRQEKGRSPCAWVEGSNGWWDKIEERRCTDKIFCHCHVISLGHHIIIDPA